MMVPIDQEKLKKQLRERGVAVVVGMYGTGKGLVGSYLKDELRKRGETIIFTSFKDLPIPSEQDILAVFGYESFAQLHAHLRKQAEFSKKKNKKLIIMIEEAQKLLEGGAKLWEVLTSLHYYQAGTVQIVLLAAPSILDAKEVLLRRLTRGNVLYPRSLTESETREYLNNTKYARAIWRISHGHFGSIKYLAQLVTENDFHGEKLTETRVVHWARARGDMDYFLQMVWEGMSLSQQQVIRRFLLDKGKTIHLEEVEQLVKVGVFWRGGRGMHWCIPWTLSFVREYVVRQKVALPDIGELVFAQFGEKEKKLVKVLWQNRMKVVKYDDLADAVWGEGREYSLWALSRLVGRVRAKLWQMGYGQLIASVRGVGYRILQGVSL